MEILFGLRRFSLAKELPKRLEGEQTKEETIKNLSIGGAAFAIGSKLGGGYGIAAGILLQSVLYDPKLVGTYTKNPDYKYTDNTRVVTSN